MKLKIMIILVLVCGLLCACGNKSELSQIPDNLPQNVGQVPEQTQEALPSEPAERIPEEATETEPAVQWPNDDLAAQCLQALIGADTAEIAAACLTENSQDRAQDMVDYYGGQTVAVQAQFKTRHGDYDIFSYEAVNAETQALVESGYGLLYRNGDQYQVCAAADLMSEVYNHFCCSTCGGSGVTYTGNQTACGICGGSGWQYIPNAYFDPVMNMWMGQNVGCGGCGGSGWISGQASTTCPGCGGSCLIFP